MFKTDQDLELMCGSIVSEFEAELFSFCFYCVEPPWPPALLELCL
jgi:hypothetical protein